MGRKKSQTKTKPKEDEKVNEKKEEKREAYKNEMKLEYKKFSFTNQMKKIQRKLITGRGAIILRRVALNGK